MLEGLNIKTYPIQGKKYALSLKDLRFSINRHKLVSGSGSAESLHKIKDLAVKIVDSKLIHIRFVATWKDDDNKIRDYTNQVTHSGSYTIWWADDEKNIKENTG